MDLKELIESVIAGSRVVEVRELGTDTVQRDDFALKAAGYGKPLLIRVEDGAGEQRSLVFHTASANSFGHDRRSDRAQAMLLDFDTFSQIPMHSTALDVGAISRDGKRLISLRDSGEFYLLTSYAEGHVYADELREVARSKRLAALDVERVDTLAHYLADLHATKLDNVDAYKRSVRDLVGSGEGIFGIIDGYPESTSDELRARLAAIEAACVGFRARLNANPERLCRTHGDFHPFNIVFSDQSELVFLDASRGCLGDPADDVACLAINYFFFALDHEHAWGRALGGLWDRFWSTYLERTGDHAIFEAIAPYLAWRGLVLANPTWYSNLSEAARNTLLTLIERALSASRFDPNMAHGLFDE